MYCTRCGQAIPYQSNFCTSCGYPTVEHILNTQKVGASKKTSSKVILISILSVTLAILIIGLAVAIVFDPFHIYTLPEREQKCYELMLDVCPEFKNPSSVRIVSGTFNYYPDVDSDYCSAYLRLSATNGFGATTTGYYFVGYGMDGGELFIFDLEDFGQDYEYFDSSIEQCKKTNDFDIERVNRELDQYWNKD
ncbi:MAG: hypothetical protein IJW49_07240 [Clostridia bacterium]|nr:hypothetical protein [Clostridia bacterium]